jgi:hypothetical protein
MDRRMIFWLLLGALAYYGFLRFRGVIGGNPLSPMPITARANGA